MTESQPLSDRYPPGLSTVVVAFAAGLAGLFGSYGAVGFAPSFVVAPVENTLSRHMPGAVITFAITELGPVGQQLNLLMAAVLVASLFALLVGLAIGIGRQLNSRVVPVVGSGVAVWVATATLTVRPVEALGAAGAAAGVVLLTDISRYGESLLGRVTADPVTNADSDSGADPNGRRRVLAGVGTAAAASAAGVVLGEQKSSMSVMGVNENIYGNVDPVVSDVDDQLTTADEQAFDVGEMEPLVSEEFYNVDISAIDPSPDASQWSLKVTGAVEEEVEFTYDDLREMEFEHRFVTLRCVGEGLNGHKTDTALWTGVPVQRLLEEAQPTSDCDCVMLRAADKFYEEFPLDALEPGLLAMGMNGDPLPRKHGAPARALVPGHWGEVNVKWLTEIELLEREKEGYWEKKGWHGTGPVNTVAKIHGEDRTEDGDLVVGGHAYAGTRGIERVEVSIDGGETWDEATLTDALPGATGPAVSESPERAQDAWRQWKYEYESPGESHEVVARATDRNGDLQPSDESGAYPSGATGWVTKSIDPESI